MSHKTVNLPTRQIFYHGIIKESRWFPHSGVGVWHHPQNLFILPSVLILWMRATIPGNDFVSGFLGIQLGLLFWDIELKFVWRIT